MMQIHLTQESPKAFHINTLIHSDAIKFNALNNPALKWCRIVQSVKRNCIIGHEKG